MKKYKCEYCGKVIERDRKQKYIKSYCSAVGKQVYVKRLDEST